MASLCRGSRAQLGFKVILFDASRKRAVYCQVRYHLQRALWRERTSYGMSSFTRHEPRCLRRRSLTHRNSKTATNLQVAMQMQPGRWYAAMRCWASMRSQTRHEVVLVVRALHSLPLASAENLRVFTATLQRARLREYSLQRGRNT